MSAFQLCPRCRQTISEKRRRIVPLVCEHCGFVGTGNEQAIDQGLEKTYLKAVIGFSIVLSLGFIQVSNWGNHAFEAATLQPGDWVGLNSSAKSERLASICFELKKWDCTERLYAQLAAETPANRLRLGKFQMSRGKFKQAAATMKKYFDLPGEKSLDSEYIYARLLGEVGEIDLASRHFEKILRAKPHVVQVTVVQNYVKYLVRADRLSRARQVIQSIRRKSETVSGFMDSELKTIQERIANQT